MASNTPYTPDINSDSADFVPSMGDYKTLQPFRYWCQKVLPLVYDDSLSYYELLCKVVDYLNKAMEDVETLHDDVDDLHTAYGQLQNFTNVSITDLRSDYQNLITYVNNYFSTLDVQQEINNKLDAMALNGSLTALLSPYVPNAVATWLSEHITPTTPAVDNTLTVSGAAADAKVTGDAINNLNSGFLDITGNEKMPFTHQGEYIVTNGETADITNFVSNADYECAVIPCVAGDSFIVTSRGQNGPRAWGFVALNGTVLEVENANVEVMKKVITAPDNTAYLVCNNYKPLTTGSIFKGKAMLIETVNQLEMDSNEYHNGFSTLANGGFAPFNQINGLSLFGAGRAINRDGEFVELSHCYATQGYIKIDKNADVSVTCKLINAPAQSPFIYVFFYSAESEASYISRFGGVMQAPYDTTMSGKAPANAKYIRISLTYVGINNVSEFYCGMGYNYPSLDALVQPYLKDKTGIILGDSISYGLYSYWDGSSRKNSDGLNPDYAPTRISDYFAELCGMSITNIAERGTGYVADTRNLGNAKVKASNTDFSNYDFIGLCFGINDYIQGKTIGDISTDGTIKGNLAYVLQKIYTDNPLAKVVVFSPYNAWGQVAVNQDINVLYGDFASNYALGHAINGNTLQDIVDAIDEVCQYYGVTHEKLNKSNVVNRLNIKDIMIDGLHPSLNSLPMLAAEMFAQKDFG